MRAESARQALDWGLVNRVVPRAELDAAVAELAENLARKLPETIRYTKTQLNCWRDLVRGQTIQHARDWLAVHSTADETLQAGEAFHQKRAPRFAELRQLQGRAKAARAWRAARPDFGDGEARRQPDVSLPNPGSGAGGEREGRGPRPCRAPARAAHRPRPLNRPKQLNALNGAVMDALCVALEELDREDGVRAIVVTGNERAFAAGADIGEMAGATPIDMLITNRIGQWDRIRKITKPVIAAVNGWALGGGCELAMTLDIIVAGEGAKLGQPEISIGVIPGAGGTQRLTRAIGKSKAMEMILTGEPITAREAEAAAGRQGHPGRARRHRCAGAGGQGRDEVADRAAAGQGGGQRGV